MGEPVQQSVSNRLLGYPADARLLIINADDLGMCNSINEAIFRALKEGVVVSTSLMTPCPWAIHAMRFLADHPDISFGVHLTLVSDNLIYRWRPLTSREKVPSLVSEDGYFYNSDRIPDLLARAKIEDIETEFRAQIETVLAAKLKPAHLDWHCLHNGGREDILDLTYRLAKEYGLALRISDHPLVKTLQAQDVPADEYLLLDSFRLEVANKAARYARMLRDLPVGLSEWAVHPGFDNSELLALEPDGDHVRQTDFEFVMSPEAREIIEQEGIILINYKAIQTFWRNRNGEQR